jgi:hypothetical protein
MAASRVAARADFTYSWTVTYPLTFPEILCT